MISLKSKKSKNIKGGALLDEDKKLIFDALFLLLKNIYDNDSFKNMNYNDNINISDITISDSTTNKVIVYDFKMTYLYFIFKYFLSLLFKILIDKTISNKDLFKKIEKLIVIISAKTKKLSVNDSCAQQSDLQQYHLMYPYFTNTHFFQQQPATYTNQKEIDITLYYYNTFFNFYIFKDIQFYNNQSDSTEINMYTIFLNSIKFINLMNEYYINNTKLYLFFSLQTDLYKAISYKSENQIEKIFYIYNQYDIESLIIIIYNFIIDNVTNFEDFITKCKDFSFKLTQDDINKYTSNQYNLNQEVLNNLFILFNNLFTQVFIKKLNEKKDKQEKEKMEKEEITKFSANMLFEANTNTDPKIKGLLYSEIDKLYKKIHDIPQNTSNLIFGGDLSLTEKIENYILIYSYYNALNEFHIAIQIIKKIIDEDTFKTVVNSNVILNELYLLLAYYYYKVAIQYNINSDVNDLFDSYINNLLLCIKYLNIYSSNNTFDNLIEFKIADRIIKLTTDKFKFDTINVIEIYKLLINEICDIINLKEEDIKEGDRNLLFLLEFAYRIYKLFFDLNQEKFTYIQKKVNDYDLSKHLNDDIKKILLNKIIEQIKKFNSLELLRIFFFKKDSKNYSKLYDIDETRKYENFFNDNEPQQEKRPQNLYQSYFISSNIFTEILKFNKDNYYPLGFDVLLSVYKYSHQISDSPTEESLIRNYRNYLLDVIETDKETDKEQKEYLKTLLNTFYMNISVLFYNLFISNESAKFNDLKKQILGVDVTPDKAKAKEIQDDFKKLELEEKNKSNIILTFIKHLKTLFKSSDQDDKNRIEFMMILFNHIYTCNKNDILKFISAMYNKLLDYTNIKIYDEN